MRSCSAAVVGVFPCSLFDEAGASHHQAPRPATMSTTTPIAITPTGRLRVAPGPALALSPAPDAPACVAAAHRPAADAPAALGPAACESANPAEPKPRAESGADASAPLDAGRGLPGRVIASECC